MSMMRVIFAGEGSMKVENWIWVGLIPLFPLLLAVFHGLARGIFRWELSNGTGATFLEAYASLTHFTARTVLAHLQAHIHE